MAIESMRTKIACKDHPHIFTIWNSYPPTWTERTSGLERLLKMTLSETTATDEYAYGLTTALENHATHLHRTRRHGLWKLILERRHSLLAYREDCRNNPVTPIRKSHRKSAIRMTGTLLCGCINSERSHRRLSNRV
jgi:hypothetical protein